LAFYEYKERPFIVHDIGRGHFTALIKSNGEWFSMDSLSNGPQVVNYVDYWESILNNPLIRHVTVVKEMDQSGTFTQRYEDAVQARIQVLLNLYADSAAMEEERARKART
jgi:hypothetical protein